MSSINVVEYFTDLPNATQVTSNETGSTYVLPFTEEGAVVSACILAMLFLFGVTANSLTMGVIYTSPRLKNRYYTFLFSMCVSDVISAFASILFLYRRTWGFLYFALPEFFCRLYWGLDLWSSFSTASHILSFAVLRLIGVRWPTKFQRISSFHMKVWIFSIWIVTFLGGFIPHFIFNTVKIIDRENDPTSARWASCSLSNYWFGTWQIYVQIAYAIMLYLPAAGIFSISIAIAVLLRRHEIPGEKMAMKYTVSSVTDNTHTTTVSSPNSCVATPVKKQVTKKIRKESAAQRRRKKDKQAIYQLGLIVLSFLIGYVPLTAFHFYTGFTIEQSNTAINIFDWRFAMVQYFMLRFSECLNPVFYNLASKKMREETKALVKRLFHISTSRRESHPVVRAGRSSSGI